METISIQVPISVARAYRQADNDKQKTAEILVNIQLREFFNPTPPQDRLENILSKIAEEAKTNGLTPEIADDFLKDV
jgi:hypothetical protein